jgi:hypothetical protein
LEYWEIISLFLGEELCAGRTVVFNTAGTSGRFCVVLIDGFSKARSSENRKNMKVLKFTPNFFQSMAKTESEKNDYCAATKEYSCAPCANSSEAKLNIF